MQIPYVKFKFHGLNLVFLGENGNKHNIRTRIFRTNNKNNTNQQAISNYYFAEYQYQKRLNTYL